MNIARCKLTRILSIIFNQKPDCFSCFIFRKKIKWNENEWQAGICVITSVISIYVLLFRLINVWLSITWKKCHEFTCIVFITWCSKNYEILMITLGRTCITSGDSRAAFSVILRKPGEKDHWEGRRYKNRMWMNGWR